MKKRDLKTIDPHGFYYWRGRLKNPSRYHNDSWWLCNGKYLLWEVRADADVLVDNGSAHLMQGKINAQG